MAKNNFTVVYENDDFVAINKPSGLLTIPDREQTEKSLKEYLKDKYGDIFTVHRLDKDTSGLVLFAKNEATHKYLSKLFEDRKVEKYYVGIVLGRPANDKGEIEAPIGENPAHKGTMNVHRNGKPSHTSYEVMEGNKYYSMVSFQLHTGRTHQIRVHSKEIGHPLAVDDMYGDGKPVLLSAIKKKFRLSKHDDEERPMISRLALHSYKLIFETADGEKLELVAEVPKEFRALMQQLKKLN
ncbi:RluA family pseudouridine synthase [Ferruginibacter sp. HRS2-29]|uniref:RluA family pseudouridine synthase n=1 Tax=Ferruginibacter sp. HRS2-29 TaxID=2487334 RepID=UPI0020CF216F|nr:RluA family pseudouridine synthase [Ferruginibacter sp. HRS2-29]